MKVKEKINKWELKIELTKEEIVDLLHQFDVNKSNYCLSKTGKKFEKLLKNLYEEIK